ncbi:hypothetical protein CCAX7_58000 [Capsulimonas corticalis]|uniref:Uncharacterized protein n=1 Tax=Capsulimonas corticalis TaxID=2219043 RepID=A0A402D085_9BACT|nr:prepilin-type N-terminal cleavage/methylation domain-containing protein [Capsulimonas corticalis]BDI33749.1 hypothetical protein CCAX7_58000 [Capsulimonas corticalis]
MNGNTAQRSGARAFTLIELLVVIAIIAILASILFPVFAKVRAQARKIACLSNEKQIGLGILQYVQDNDEKFPSSDWFNHAHCDLTTAGCGKFRPDNGLLTYADAIYPYVKSTQVFQCPNHPKDALGYGLNTFLTPVANPSAFMTATGWYRDEGFNYKYVATIAQINEPSNRIMIGELASGNGAGDAGPWYNTLYQDNFNTLAAGQNGFCNYVFCDGHAKSMKVKATIWPKFLWNAVDDWNLQGNNTSMVAIPSGTLSYAGNEAGAQALYNGAFDPKNTDL